jgi:hypothetical protein
MFLPQTVHAAAALLALLAFRRSLIWDAGQVRIVPVLEAHMQWQTARIDQIA